MFKRFSVSLIAALAGLVLAVAGVALWLSRGTLPEPGPAAPAEVRTLRLGLNIAAGSALHAAALRFAEEVESRSQGRVKVTVHPDQQLGSDDQMLEMARQGKLDFLLTPTAKLSSAIPAMQYADLPFYFSGRDELYAMLDGEPGQLLLSKLNTIDLVGLAFWENGFKQFTANTPIHGPGDLAGLRMRTMKSRLIVDQFETLGAKAIPIDFHATYQALADGAVDGEENPLVAIVGMRFHEVQKHLTLSNHAYLGYVFSASKQVFGTLPPDIRTLIQTTARDLTVWERDETARREAGFIETIKQAGVAIHTLSPEERAAFSRAMAPIADKFAFEVGYDLLVKTEELRHAQALARGDQSWVIGVDADFSKRGSQAGGAIYRGAQLAVEEINAQGGLLGRPVRLVALDHGANPQVGRQNIERFAAMPGLLAVVGGMHSSVILEELADIHRLQIPYLIPWAAGQGLTDNGLQPNYVFRLAVSDAQVAPLLLERALKEGGRVVIFLEKSAWGRSNEAVLKPLIERQPPGNVSIEWVTLGDPGLEAQVLAATRKGPRAVVMAANFMESLAVVRALASLERPLPVFAHWGLTSGDFFRAAQQPLQRVDLRFVQTVLMAETDSHPRLKPFLKHYRERYGLAGDDPLPSPNGSIHAYDLVHLLARAAGEARSPSREDLRAALENPPAHAGVVRDYRPAFTRERHDALDRSVLRLARFDGRGRIVQAD